jgi:hypothetical protein
MICRSEILCALLFAAAIVATAPAPARAEDWMFRRSYYSHTPPPGVEPAHPLPESRSAYRTAHYREAFGWSVRSAYRWNNYVLQSGPRTDRTYYREGYVEFDP